MTNKIEAWAVVRLDGMLKQTYNSEKAANSTAIMFKAQSLSTTQPEDFKVVRLVEETNDKPERKKKWFVRSKGFTRGNYTYSKINRSGTNVQNTFEKSDAMSFDTQEEAEKWVNPLNEAVLLEIEE